MFDMANNCLTSDYKVLFITQIVMSYNFRYIETISVQAKVVISYDPESNLMLFRTCAFLPYTQPETDSYLLHISYFLQNCKKGKPDEMDLPY
jgi:hypothetical protein